MDAWRADVFACVCVARVGMQMWVALDVDGGWIRVVVRPCVRLRADTDGSQR